MKKVAILLVAITVLFLMAACGGDSTDEPTPTDSPTPTPTITEEATPSPTPEPTQEASPTPQPTSGNSVEAVLADKLSKLVLAYAEVNGEWQCFKGPNANSLTTLKRGSAYWIYSTEEIMPEASGFLMALNEGWQEAGPIAWMAEDATSITALQADKDSILFVIGFDNVSKKFTAYMSPSVSPMMNIMPGDYYCTFAGNPPAPQESCQTR